MGIFLSERINQHPVRLDMTVAAAGKVSAQRVILECRRQWLPVYQQFQHGLELLQILAALAGQFDILLKLRGAAE
jgi:hypothetical protein